MLRYLKITRSHQLDFGTESPPKVMSIFADFFDRVQRFCSQANRKSNAIFVIKPVVIFFNEGELKITVS